MHSGFRRKLNQLMLYCIQDKGCSIKIFDLGGEVHQADHILVIKDGELIEQGSHDELLGHGGFYYGLYSKQLRI